MRKFRMISLFLLSMLLLSSVCFARHPNDPVAYRESEDLFSRIELNDFAPLLYRGKYYMFVHLSDYQDVYCYGIPMGGSYLGADNYVYNPVTGMARVYIEAEKDRQDDTDWDTFTKDTGWKDYDKVNSAIRCIKERRPDLYSSVEQETARENTELDAKKKQEAALAEQKALARKEEIKTTIEKYKEKYNALIADYDSTENRYRLFDEIAAANKYFFVTNDQNYYWNEQGQTGNVKHIHWVGNKWIIADHCQYDWEPYYISKATGYAYFPYYNIVIQLNPDESEKHETHTDEDLDGYYYANDAIVKLDPIHNAESSVYELVFNVENGDIAYSRDVWMDSQAKDGVSAIQNKKGHFSDGDEDANMAIITFYRHARPFCTMSKDQLVKNTMAYQSTTAYQKACEYGLTY